jgi:hypothetical protein
MFHSLDDDVLPLVCLTILRTAISEIAQRLCENVLNAVTVAMGERRNVFLI